MANLWNYDFSSRSLYKLKRNVDFSHNQTLSRRISRIFAALSVYFMFYLLYTWRKCDNKIGSIQF